MKVKIYGAGSIGNHYAFGCRQKNWQVTIFDKDPEALIRTKKKIYSLRYGKWDDKIKLITEDDHLYYDLIIIGTPPDTHLKIAVNCLKFRPKIIHIEKPFCTPDLKFLRNFINRARKAHTKIIVGYNQIHTKSVEYVKKFLKFNNLGKIKSIYSCNKESWNGILAAHPWLKGPQDSYLGYYKKGGGAANEHSHALSLLLFFFEYLNLGSVKEVSCFMNFVKKNKMHYDSFANINLVTSKNYLGNVVQDVTSEVNEKVLIIQGSLGSAKIVSNFDSRNDLVETIFKGKKKIVLFRKSRPDDFKGHIEHLNQILLGKIKNSPVSIDHAIKTSVILSECFTSAKKNKKIKVKYKI